MSGRKQSFSALRAMAPPSDPKLAESVDARLGAAARLELARAIHHLKRVRKRRGDHVVKRTKVGGSFAADEWTRQTQGLITALSPGKALGPRLGAAVQRLMRMEAQGLVTAREAEHAFDEVTRFLTSHTKVGSMSTTNTDLPAELSAYSDGVTDDDAFHPEIIGCPLPGLDIAEVAGVPGYLFSKKNLSNPVIRRRLANHIKAMTPKVRRRVLERLRSAVSVASRVSGEVRNAYPSIAGCSSDVGWTAQSVSVGRCPFSRVAGPLTP
ncbi:MAG TPA: hypothetical protein VGK73_04095 [Polyangiaceae bacterium]